MEFFAAFTLYAFISAVTPGPNNIMLTASGANFGFRNTVPHILGVQIGFAIMMLIVGFGLGAVFQNAPRLQLALKVVGVAYLLWLAWKIATATKASGDADAQARPMTLIEAALFQWVNAKAWMMIIGAFAVYGGGGDPRLVIPLTILFFLAGAPTSVIWAAFGVAIRHLLADPKRLRLFNIAMALLLVASIIPMVM